MVTVLDPARLTQARDALTNVRRHDIDQALTTEGEHRHDAALRRQPTGRRPGCNPRCQACRLFQPYGCSDCPHCGYVPGVGYPGRRQRRMAGRPAGLGHGCGATS